MTRQEAPLTSRRDWSSMACQLRSVVLRQASNQPVQCSMGARMREKSVGCRSDCQKAGLSTPRMRDR